MAVRVFWPNVIISVVTLNLVLAQVASPTRPLVPVKHVQGNVFEVGDEPGPYQITNAQMVKKNEEDSGSGGGFMDFITGPTEYLANMLMGSFLGSSSSSSDEVSPGYLSSPGLPRRRPPGLSTRPKRMPGRKPGRPFARGPRFPPGLRPHRLRHPALYPQGDLDQQKRDLKLNRHHDGHWTGGFSSHFKLFEGEPSEKVIVHVGGKRDNKNTSGERVNLDVSVNEVESQHEISSQQTVPNTAHKRANAKPFQETAASDKSFTVSLPFQTIDTRGASNILPRLDKFSISDVPGYSNSQLIRSTERSTTRQPTYRNSFSENFESRPQDNVVAENQDVVHKWEQWGALIGKRPTRNSIAKTNNEANNRFEKTLPGAPTTLQTIYNNMVSLHKSLTGTLPSKLGNTNPKITQTTQQDPKGFFQGSYTVVKPYDDIDNIKDAIRQETFGNSATPPYIASASVSNPNIFSRTPANLNRFTNTAQVKTVNSSSFESSGVWTPAPNRYNQNVNGKFQNSNTKEDQKFEKGKLHSVADVVDALKIVADALENTAEDEKIFLTKFAEDIFAKNEQRRSGTDKSDTDSKTSSYTSYQVEPVNFVDLTAVNGNGAHLTVSSYSKLR